MAENLLDKVLVVCYTLIKKGGKPMNDSILRELIRLQDTLKEILPNELWQSWAEENEKVCEHLRKESDAYG